MLPGPTLSTGLPVAIEKPIAPELMDPCRLARHFWHPGGTTRLYSKQEDDDMLHLMRPPAMPENHIA